MPQVDYDAIAKQFRGTAVSPPATAINYDALAREHGGQPVTQVATPLPPAATRGMMPPSTMQDAAPEPAPEKPGVVRQAFDELGGTTPRREGLRWGTMQPDMAAQLEDVEVMGSPLTPMAAGGLKAATATAKAVQPVVWPTRAAAGAKFSQVAKAAADVPVDISGPGNVALRIYEATERGAGSMPRPVMQFLRRVTDSSKPDLLYPEAREWASNLSRLSADETRRLSPAGKRLLHELRVAMNHANARAASQAKVGPQYHAAMKEYARASRNRMIASQVGKRAMQAIAAGTIGAGAYGTAKAFGVNLP